jgi:hypothetical protein
MLIVAMLCLLAGPVWSGEYCFFVSGSEVIDSEESFGAGMRVSVGDAFGVDLTFTYYKNTNVEFALADGVVEDTLGFMPIDLGVRYNMEVGAAHPYVGAGASIIMLNLDELDVHDEVGFYGLLGVTFTVWKDLGLFVEAIYRDAEAPITQVTWYGVPAEHKFPMDVGGLGANIGVAWVY